MFAAALSASKQDTGHSAGSVKTGKGAYDDYLLTVGAVIA
jgi:hypothetical protein